MRIALNSLMSLVLVAAAGILAFAQEATPKDTTTFPDNGTIRCIEIRDYTSPMSDNTNCYLLTGKTGQAILIDPAEELSPDNSKRFVVDKLTGKATTMNQQQLAAYLLANENPSGLSTMREKATGREQLLYDAFTPTGRYATQLLRLLDEQKLTLKYIILTHGHLDHFCAISALCAKTGAQVMMHRDDLRGINGAKLTAPDEADIVGYPKDAYRIAGLTKRVDRILHDGDLITLDGITLQVLHTPGHSPGSICLRTRQRDKSLLFSGDTLLHWYTVHDYAGNSYTFDNGRTNFLDGSGDEALLYRMIREKLLTLPGDTTVFPGHGLPTTIGEEKKYSPARTPTPTAP
ncbi:MAG TPA: MBL fold metallo-hydrolase [Armatimonadota bacterium]|jgi:glyoxylase-like metal-dependent hydrolase (beta-lactamase superfamily II)